MGWSELAMAFCAGAVAFGWFVRKEVNHCESCAHCRLGRERR